jgi:hypothetical protein
MSPNRAVLLHRHLAEIGFADHRVLPQLWAAPLNATWPGLLNP